MSERSVPTRTCCVIDGQTVVLDRLTSRYFLVSAVEDEIGARPPLARPCVSAPDGPGEAVEVTIAPVRRMRGAPARRAQLGPLLRLWLLERRYARLLRRGGLDAGLSLLESVTPMTRSACSLAVALIDAAAASRRLWSPRDRCLPRSLALVHALRTLGHPALLVLGVALQPFAAHAWVQAGEVVLNDELDHVLLFAPILVA